MTRVRLGVIGAGFGERVLVPAFRRAGADIRAIATRSDRTAAAAAQRLKIPHAYGSWKSLLSDPSIDAVAVAVPPIHQPAIVWAALRSNKPVFAEKPLATSAASARVLAAEARRRHLATAVDFELPEIPEWVFAQSVLASKKLGRLRQVTLTWHVETYTNRQGVSSWKTRSKDGGGALLAFASHSFHYLEKFCGPIRSLMAQLSSPASVPGKQETHVIFAAQCAQGTSISGSISTHAFLGAGHRLEFYGDRGTMILENSTDDYGKGFRLRIGTRAESRLKLVRVPHSKDYQEDGRIAPVARLAKRFLDSCTKKGARMSPSFEEGYRVQVLLEACKKSDRLGKRVSV